MCQQPTQSFFRSALGLPLTMVRLRCCIAAECPCAERLCLVQEPNFEDLSCVMTFGAQPPELEEDPVFMQPCFTHQCKLGNRDPAAPCPKTDTARKQVR